MKCEELSLCNLLESNNSKFIIPVYQRKYYWDSINCSQLYTDLLRLIKNPNEKHFLGAVVIINVDASNDKMIIDGQQRITSLSLFILAAIKAVKDGIFPDTNELLVCKAFDNYIDAKYVSDDRKIKLQLLDEDCVAYDKIVRGEEDLIEQSFVTRNFMFFYDLLCKNRNLHSFEEILSAADRLQIVSIHLGQEDDPQLIFESINSTGLALNDYDKIRNYMLMSVPQKDMHEYFYKYWVVIEQATNNKLEEFIRVYLTLKQNLTRPVNYGDIYLEWKKYMQTQNRLDVLEDMLYFALLFKKIDLAKFSKDSEDKLSRKMRQINTLQSKVYYIFLMSFLDYAQSNNLPEEEVFNVLNILENYLARRAIVDTKSNALTGVFCSLHKKILTTISFLEKTDSGLDFSYSDVMSHHIVNLSKTCIMPRDDDFVEAIKNCCFYNKPKETKMFVFERLENARLGEINDVVADMSLNKTTVEHIMPQALNDSWKDMLGNNYKTIYKKYLHTLANLTLTGYNSSLKNKPFLEKRDGEDYDGGALGYRDSKYRITSKLTKYDKWTQEELDQRAEEITNTLLKLFPFPEDKLKSLSLQIEEYHLDDEIPLNKRTLDGFTLWGQDYECSSWKEFFTKTLQLLLEFNSTKFDPLFNNKGRFLYDCKGKDDVIEIAANRFVCCSDSQEEYINVLRELFSSFNIDCDDLVIKFKLMAQESFAPNIDTMKKIEFSLADDVDFTNCKVIGYYLFNEKQDCKSSATVFKETVEKIVKLYPEKCEELFQEGINFYTKKKDGVEYFTVGPHHFVRQCVSNNNKLSQLRKLFDHVGIPRSSLRIVCYIKQSEA